MKWTWFSIFAGALLLAQPQVTMIQPGTFGRALIGSLSGAGWIGLAPGRDGFEWKRYRIQVQVRTGKTTVEIIPPEAEEPLFLLRGLPGLAKNAVQTCFDRSETGSLYEQNPILLTCEAGAYRIEVTNANRKITGAGASLLQLSHEGKSQTLFRWDKGLTDQPAEVVWVGDLDGDDKVDLLVDHGALTLYLSSRATAGQLVGRLASFRRL